MKKALVTVALIATTASNTIIGFPLAASAQKKFSGFDQSCKPVPAVEEWTIEKMFQFSDQGENYKLVFSRTIDGSGSFCLLQGNSGKPMGLKYWESEFIDRVDRISAKVFTFQVHEGNGSPTPTKKYRLNLTQPQNPKITLLKKWIVP